MKYFFKSFEEYKILLDLLPNVSIDVLSIIFIPGNLSAFNCQNLKILDDTITTFVQK